MTRVSSATWAIKDEENKTKARRKNTFFIMEVSYILEMPVKERSTYNVPVKMVSI
jgi:hypothetical protein